MSEEEGRDSSFQIKVVLLFNPTLKPANRKALEDEIQDTKILYYYPPSAVVQQKRNHVGLAEGMYFFFDSMLEEPTESIYSKTNTEHDSKFNNNKSNQNKVPRRQVVYMDTQIFIIQEVQPDIWILLGLVKQVSCSYSKQQNQYLHEQVHNYSFETFTESLCYNIISHFYQSFLVFNNTIDSYSTRLPELSVVMTEFISRYIYLNESAWSNSLEADYYQFSGLRLAPMDCNYQLKFLYFQSILKSLDSKVKHLLIFYSGYLVFSSLPPEWSVFLCNYYYALGHPFRFDDSKIKKRFTDLKAPNNSNAKHRYGYFANLLALGTNLNDKNNTPTSKEDLLGLDEDVETLTIWIDGVRYQLSTYLENKMLFITLADGTRSLDKLVSQNKYFNDNVDRFVQKIGTITGSLLLQPDNYKFIYLNKINHGGKMTISFDEYSEVGILNREFLDKLERVKEGEMLATCAGWWLYGVRRVNRLLVVALNNDTPLHKVEEAIEKIKKDYFPAIYM